MKVTMRAILVEVQEDHKQKINELMTVFCSAIRYSFKRILENKKIGDIEKDIASKYGLNIRQAKDAVENARQTIASQKELIKMNYDDFTKKVKAIEKAKENECGIVVEDLKFKNDRDVNSKFARIKHQFIYSTLLAMLESACYREGIELIKVKPQFTSKIGLYKYCHQYGMVVHNGAAMVIARRSYKFKEKVPKILRDKFVDYKESFDKKNEWARWAIINKIIQRKVGEKPDLWLKQRKEVLGII